MSVQLKLSTKLKNSFEYFEVHLPFFHRFVILDLNLHLDYKCKIVSATVQRTAKQAREHISNAIRSKTIRGFAGKDITQARGQNSEIFNRFYGKRQTCTMRPSRISPAQIRKSEAREYQYLLMGDAMLDASLFHALRYETVFFLS